MKDLIDNTPWWYKGVIIFNALLIVVSFILPPQGIIDPSVLTAVGEVFGGAFLGMLPTIIKQAKTVKVAKGDTTIEIEARDRKHNV